MAEKGDSGGTKNVLIFLALIALIGVTCFAPIYKGKPLLHLLLPSPTTVKQKPKPQPDLILLQTPKAPLDTHTANDEQDLDQLIRKSKKKKKK